VSVVATRVDGRLVHGQVVVAWVPAVRCDRLGIADDALAGDSWEKDLVESASEDTPVDVASVAEAVSWYREEGLPRRFVLLRSLASLLELVRAGAPVPEAVLGGIHHRTGARRFLAYLYLTRADIEALRELDRAGVRLIARDVPGNPAVDVNRALAEGRLEYDQLPAGTS